MIDYSHVSLPEGKILAKRWKVLEKLGRGGCGSVFKVEDLKSGSGDLAALKAESTSVVGGSLIKLEVQILRRLDKKPYVAKLLHSGKKQGYNYMVMTLLGDSLDHILKRMDGTVSVSTQVRIGVNLLFGMKQIHEIGFVHRDLKPANVALGLQNTPESRFFHILDFGLAREFIILEPMERREFEGVVPRHYSGTARYCSLNAHECQEQGRVDDLWSLLYMLAELRGPLPWANTRDRKGVHLVKKEIELDELLEECPAQLLQFGQHLQSLNYSSRPDYALLFGLLQNVMQSGNFKYTDPWDWDCAPSGAKGTMQPHRLTQPRQDGHSEDVSLVVPKPVCCSPSPYNPQVTALNPFPAEEFGKNKLGF